MSQQFCLKWNNHTSNMLQVFESLLSTEALVDVTLACDGLSLKAHKMVLSACSPFFQSLFLENPCKHPIVIMKDMRYSDLKAIIDFMYRGEVNVSHDQLSALLKTAETLKVKGLAEVTGENRHAAGIVQQEISPPIVTTPLTPTAQRTDTPPLQGKRKRGRPRKRSLSDSNRSDDEGVASKIQERDSPDVEELSGDASMEATSDIRSGGLPNSLNSQSQVPSHSSNNVNSFSKSHLSASQDPQVDDASGDENEFEVEPSKLLEQTLTTENVPSNSQNSTGHITLPSVSGLEISRRSMSSTDSVSQALVPASDSLGSNLQGPDSPQDIKPQILSFDDPPISPVAGTSHGSERSMMMYMDQTGVSSIAGPSNYQENSALVPHDSQPQDKNKIKNLRSGSRICDQFSCIVCPYSSNSKDDIRQHVQIHSDGKSISLPQRMPRRLTCPYCPFKTFSHKAMTQHSKSHSDFRYTCYRCKQQFPLKTELTEHLKTHKSSEVYKCDICAQEFTLINVLTYHRKSHIQSKSFTCQYCQKVFCDVVVFNQHIKLHLDTESNAKVKEK